KGFNDSGLKTRPSELFQRNCWISFEPVEGSIKVLADYIGGHKILWATDYPHPDGFFPGAPDMLRQRLQGVSPATQHQIFAGGAMGFYGLNWPPGPGHGRVGRAGRGSPPPIAGTTRPRTPVRARRSARRSCRGSGDRPARAW